VDAGRRLLADALDSGKELWVLVVDQLGEVTAVVQDHVKGLAVGEVDGLLDAPVSRGNNLIIL